MAYIEHSRIYSLEERNESEISPMWQIIQVVFYLFCIGFGIAVRYLFSSTKRLMQYNCLLYAKIVFYENINSHTNSSNINIIRSQFHNVYCDLVIYIPVIITTFACFFLVMFIYCGRGGAGNRGIPDTWRIVLPAFFFNFTSFCLSVFICILLQNGSKSFVNDIAKSWGIEEINVQDIIYELYLEGVHIGEQLYKYLIATKHAMWMLISFWGLSFSWVLLRCLFIVDFQLVRTSVYVYPKQSAIFVNKTIKGQDGETDVTSNNKSESDFDETVQGSSNSGVRLRTVHFSPSTENVHGPDSFTSAKFKNVATSTTSIQVDTLQQEEEVEEEQDLPDLPDKDDESSNYFSMSDEKSYISIKEPKESNN